MIKELSVQLQSMMLVRDSDKQCVRLRCRSKKDCPFLMNAAWKDDTQQATINKVVGIHNCLGSVAQSQSVTSSVEWLVATVPSLIFVDKKTTSRQIQQMILRRDLDSKPHIDRWAMTSKSRVALVSPAGGVYGIEVLASNLEGIHSLEFC